MTSHLGFTVRQDDQLQTLFMDMVMEVVTASSPAANPGGRVEPGASGDGRIVWWSDAGFALTFADDWVIERTSPETHAFTV